MRAGPPRTPRTTRALRQASHVPEDPPDLARSVTEGDGARQTPAPGPRRERAKRNEGPVVGGPCPRYGLDVTGGVVGRFRRPRTAAGDSG